MSSPTSVMTDCIDYMSHIIITSDVYSSKQHITLWWQDTHHVYKLHMKDGDMLQNTLRVGTLVHSSRLLQIKGSHEPISSHGHIGMCCWQWQTYNILHLSEDIYKGLYKYNAKQRHNLTCKYYGADYYYIQAYKQLERIQNVLILEHEAKDNKGATRRCFIIGRFRPQWQLEITL